MSKLAAALASIALAAVAGTALAQAQTPPPAAPAPAAARPTIASPIKDLIANAQTRAVLLWAPAATWTLMPSTWRSWRRPTVQHGSLRRWRHQRAR